MDIWETLTSVSVLVAGLGLILSLGCLVADYILTPLMDWFSK